MSSIAPSSSPKPFDLVIGWQPLVEETVAAWLLSDAPVLAMKAHGKQFKQEHLDMCRGNCVLICGSYFSADEIFKVTEVATRVTVWCYSDGDAKSLMDQVRPTHACATTIDVGRFTLDKFKEFPRATRLLRRSLEPDHPEHTIDEAFYRGMMHHAFAEPFTQEEAIQDWLAGSSDDNVFIETGMTVAMEHDRIAANIVQNGAVVVKRAQPDLTLRVVVSGCSLVMPVADEAAKGVDIGVVVRYDLVKQLTMLTFVTHNKTDLSFVEKVPFCGGGRDNCKGTSITGCVPVHVIIDRLSRPQTIYDGEWICPHAHAILQDPKEQEKKKSD